MLPAIHAHTCRQVASGCDLWAQVVAATLNGSLSCAHRCNVVIFVGGRDARTARLNFNAARILSSDESVIEEADVGTWWKEERVLVSVRGWQLQHRCLRWVSQAFLAMSVDCIMSSPMQLEKGMIWIRHTVC